MNPADLAEGLDPEDWWERRGHVGVVHRRTLSDTERLRVLVDADGLCAYCGDVALYVDHIIPASRGGTNHPWNLVAACKPCNSAKIDLMPWEWRAGDLQYRNRRQRVRTHLTPPIGPRVGPHEFGACDTSDPCIPVGAKEIASRLGVKRQTAAMWKLRGLMPPVRWMISGMAAWCWYDIEEWARSTGRL